MCLIPRDPEQWEDKGIEKCRRLEEQRDSGSVSRDGLKPVEIGESCIPWMTDTMHVDGVRPITSLHMPSFIFIFVLTLAICSFLLQRGIRKTPTMSCA